MKIRNGLTQIAKTWKPCKCATVAQLIHNNIPMYYKNVASRDNFEGFKMSKNRNIILSKKLGYEAIY